MRNLGGDEFIAKCMSYVVNVCITSAKALNFMYENPKTAASVVKPSSKKISDLFYFLIELFNLALHSSHVLGSRSIIDSTEPDRCGIRQASE